MSGDVKNGTEAPEQLSPCLIRVDKEGRFWHLGAEMTHEGINRLLMDHVELDDRGRYIISFHGQRCFVEVEDTFFVIVRVEGRMFDDGSVGELAIYLNDGAIETLDASTLEQNEDNVLYARIKDGRFPARFLRGSYYQLAEYVVEKNGRYVLPLGGREYVLA